MQYKINDVFKSKDKEIVIKDFKYNEVDPRASLIKYVVGTSLLDCKVYECWLYQFELVLKDGNYKD